MHSGTFQKVIRNVPQFMRWVNDSRHVSGCGLRAGSVRAMSPQLGMCFDRELPASFVVEVAERLESDGVDQLWVIEDCFYTAGISLAATALARTERLVVGLGILPVVARNPAVTAMELATLADLAPGRLLAGIGHGVQEWMDQMGARTASPLTTLEEVFTVVGRLLRGETVSFDGREVTMSDVTLDAPPTEVPPLLAGVRGPKSLAVAGRVADGLVLAEGAGPTYVAQSIAHAGSPDPFRVSVFSALCVQDDAKLARRIMAPFVCGLLADPGPAPLAHPHIDEIQERFTERGEDGIADMPADWWIELGAIGSFDDVITHIEALADAGAHDVALFAGPKVDYVREDLDHVANIAAALH
jgi:5,10-methylenetetrahydromethanopterin reductase